MSAEKIVADIEYMIKYYGAKGIYFREDNFTLNKKRIVDFCNLILKKNIIVQYCDPNKLFILKTSSFICMRDKRECRYLFQSIVSLSFHIFSKFIKKE